MGLIRNQYLCTENASDTEHRLVFLSCMELQQGCVLLVLWGMLHVAFFRVVSSVLAALVPIPSGCFFVSVRLHFGCHIDSSFLFIHRIAITQTGFPQPTLIPILQPFFTTPYLLQPPWLLQPGARGLKWKGSLQVKG